MKGQAFPTKKRKIYLEVLAALGKHKNQGQQEAGRCMANRGKADSKLLP